MWRKDTQESPLQRGQVAEPHTHRHGWRWGAAVLLVFYLCLRSEPAKAATFFWTGSTSGNVSDTGRWSLSSGGGAAGFPTSTDAVVYDGNGTGNSVINIGGTASSFSINSGYTGTITLNSGQTENITGDFNQAGGTYLGTSGTVTIGGNFNLSGGTLTSSSGLVEIQGAFTKTGGTFNHNSGRVLLSAATSKTFASNGATFNNLYINDGLIGYWKLDESASPNLDSSGYGRSATWAGAATASAAVPTTPTFADTRCLAIANAADRASFTSPAASILTIAAWVKTTAIASGSTTTQRIVELPGFSLFLNNSAAAAPDNPSSIGFTSQRATTAGDWRTPPSSLAAGAWYHIAVTYDASSTATVPVLYINGVPRTVTTKSTPAGAATSNAGTGYMGNRSALDSFFNGFIDDVRIYNRALTAAQINSLALGNQPGTSVATQTLTGSPTFAGDLVIASGTLATGGNNLIVGGSWWNYGGLVVTGGAGSVTFNGSSPSNIIRSSGQIFENIIINGTGTWTLGDRLETAPSRSITTTAGTLDLSSRTLRTGNIIRNVAVTITPSTSTVILGGDASKTLDTGSFTNLHVEPVTATSLVGYWKLDEGQGTTFRDYSGNGNSGALLNGPLWANTAPPAVSFEDPGAVSLDGTNDYATLGITNLPALASSATIAAWVNYAAIPSAAANAIALGSASGLLQLGFRGSAITAWKNGGNVLVTASSTPSSGWHHLVYTFDGTTNSLYVDGGTPATSTAAPDTGAVTTAWLGTYDGAHEFFGGILDDVRIYNVALSRAQVQALAAGTYPSGLAGAPSYTLGKDTTVTGTFTQDAGTFDTSTFALNVSSTASAAVSSSGTYTVGSSTSTFSGGLNISRYATLGMASSGGAVKIGSAQTLTIDGALNASSTGATIQTAGASSTFYAFKVGSSATATPTLNITGLAVKNTDTNGMYINAVAGAATTFTRFDNIAFSAGTGARLLQIYAPSLYLVSNGCSFDGGAASSTTTRNVTLRGDGSATETRAVFGNATCLNGSSPTYSLCEANDDDDDANVDGVGDNVATNAAVIQWVHAGQADTSGTIEGFPAAAFDWNTFTYYSTYVLFHDVGGGTADRIYVRSTDGTAKYSWDSPAGVDLIGSPRFDTVSSTHYVYVATTSGKVFRLVDNGSSSLTLDSTGGWANPNNPFDCSCTIATPLTIDSTNIYWGGLDAGSNSKVWTLGKASRALATGSPIATSLSVAVSGAAPSVWVDSTPHTQMFLGSASHYFKVDINTQQLTTDSNVCPTGTVNGRLSILASKVYGADSGGSLCVLDAATFTTTSWSYHDNTNHSGCAAGSTCAITGSLYVDPLTRRAFYGDGDGHLYASYNSSGTTGAQMTGFPYRPGSASDIYGSAPLYNSGILVVGTTTGTVYVIDINGGSGPVLQQTYKFGATTKISGVGYDKGSASYMIATADPTNKDGRLVYIDSIADPTPSSN